MTPKLFFECECGYRYFKPFWEPAFLASKLIRYDHPNWHETFLGYRNNPETHPEVVVWRKWEKDRIISIIKSSNLSDYEKGFLIDDIEREAA